MHMQPGYFTMDKSRIQIAARQISDVTRKRRKMLRRLKKGYEDKNQEEEGVVYDAGMGD